LFAVYDIAMFLKVGAALRRPANRFGRDKPLAQTGFLYGTNYYFGVAPGRAAPTGTHP